MVEKFRPYALPAPAWLKHIQDRLVARSDAASR